LWVCERVWCDLMAYNPGLPSEIHRMARNEACIGKIAERVTAFSQRLEALYQDVIKRGWVQEIAKPSPSLVDILKESIKAVSV
jgi:hypothetical protein